MRLGRKLLYYMLGVGLGVFMVYFMFGDRDIQCNYFPNDRVLYDLRKKEMRLAADLIDEQGVVIADTGGLSASLERARVDFEKSRIDDQGCNVYFLKLKEMEKAFEIENCDSIATLLRVN